MSLTSDDLEAMYVRHAEDLIGYFHRRVRDPELSRDLLGETFLAAFSTREQCLAEDDRQRIAWLYGIAAHKLERHARRSARERRALRRLGPLQALTTSDHQRIEQLSCDPELQARVQEALAGLSKEQQQAIRSRVLSDRPYREVATELGISEEAARARVARGMAMLRRAIRPLRADTQ